MSKRIRRRLRRANPKPPRPPKYGDEVYIPSEHPDGHWCNGIVNSGWKDGVHADGELLIAAPGHAKSNLVAVRLEAYGVGWAYPEDVGRKPMGTKRAYLEDVQG